MRISGINEHLNNKVFSYDMLAFNSVKSKSDVAIVSDSVVSYSPMSDHYEVSVKANSAAGYYAFLSKLLFTCIGVLVLWLFKRIFEKANVAQIFQKEVYKLLIVLAIAFLISDILALADYIIVNKIIGYHLQGIKLSMLTDLGRGAIAALIIIALATIYHRGIKMQEEIDMTV